MTATRSATSALSEFAGVSIGGLYALTAEARYADVDGSTFVETDETEIKFQGMPAGTVVRFLESLNGQKSIAEASECASIPLWSAAAIVDELVRSGAAIEVSDGTDAIISAADFVTLCATVFVRWKRRVFSHPLWVSLSNGTATANEFAGWLLETYHFIETVNSRLSLAIAECRDFEARKHFAHHYSEEWDHHHFFMLSLTRLGFDEAQVIASLPLPGTLAVVNCMRDAARRDPLNYAACSGFLESTGDDRAAGRRFFDLLIENYCRTNPGVVQPMRAHLDLDEQYGHNGVLEDIAPHVGTLTRERVAGALRTVMQLVETLELWSTDILRHYSTTPAIPIAPVRIYSATTTRSGVDQQRASGGAA